MRLTRHLFSVIFSVLLLQVSLPAFSQLGISFDLKKPQEYDERVLGSEKSADKKFTLPRRFIQNTVTHYNYNYNATTKLNEVLERAKLAFKEDYSRLLPFYNYSLDATIQDSIQLDSVAYKASTGVILHDLRNDWVDNLYILWGASYYLKKQFDSAYMMFQFINYAFAPKEKDGYYLTIGSNRDGNSANSIATKEKNSLPKKIFAEPPSRNDAFIWQIRNFLAQDAFPEAASLIVTLRNDPAFPKRLQNDLHEVQALWFYKQNMWDSAAIHLVEALSNATNKQEKARWEYLVGQLYENAGRYEEAEKYFVKVSAHTTDPIMDIYARLAAIRVNKDEGGKTIEKNVAELLKMAKRDKYVDYRDIIYFMAAQMLIEGRDIQGALALLLKSTQYTSNNAAQRNKAFLQLAELSFDRKEYRSAYNFYDSLVLGDTSLGNPEAITLRKAMLGHLATQMEIVVRQDSIQRIALLPEDERKDFVKRLAKQLRKQQGLKDEGVVTTGSPFTTNTAPTLFPTRQTKGEWYFYNEPFRAQGLNEFKLRWGTRPNIDNWRRSASISATTLNNSTVSMGDDKPNNVNLPPGEITFDGLYERLPLTTELLQQSNDSLALALFSLGKVYIREIEDCNLGTETMERLRKAFPAYDQMDEVLFNLYYCYNKNGESAKAAEIKRLMNEKHPGSNYTIIVTTGKNPRATGSNSEATKMYEKIYDLFIEGKFDQAISEKKAADNIYGKNFWTPQLLYIESVFYIKQRDDATARTVLTNITTQFPNTPLAKKATTLLDVLARRSQIENELNNLNVTRYADDSSKTPPVTVIPVQKPIITDTTSKAPPVVIKPVNTKDTSTTRPGIITPPVTYAYKYTPAAGQYVVLILNKVDQVFMNEAKNAFFRYNRETFYNKTYAAELVAIDDDNKLLLISPFKDEKEALEYITRTEPKTATEIIPWLKGGKYNFSVISAANLEILKAEKNIDKYKAFLGQHLPGVFK